MPLSWKESLVIVIGLVLAKAISDKAKLGVL